MSLAIAKVCDHEESCLNSSLLGLRNGFFYGGRIRLMNALVVTILFKKVTSYYFLLNKIN